MEFQTAYCAEEADTHFIFAKDVDVNNAVNTVILRVPVLKRGFVIIVDVMVISFLIVRLIFVRRVSSGGI